MKRCAGLLVLLFLFAAVGLARQDAKKSEPADPYEANNRTPDDRYKADVLLVVAHPDDEIMAAAYLSREIEQGKRVAVVWTTRGDGGQNVVGPEQAAAMGDIREVEAMRGAASIGIGMMWNLGGPDTPTQDPLESLATCHHGYCLERLVRIVRLTRPSVMLTWLPVPATGENHGDHQAAGILATEAFDAAGDPSSFAEQVTPAAEPRQNDNRLDGLRPWQPQKIYYFSNPTHREFFSGKGPEYSAADISPKRHIAYGQMAAEEFMFHRTQGGGKALEEPIPWTEPTQLILGKSWVGGQATDDVFAGVVSEGIPYRRAPGFNVSSSVAPALEIGGVWNFYRQFWQSHGLDHLSHLVPYEATVAVGGTLIIPLIIQNPSSTALSVVFHVEKPQGFELLTPPASISVGPHSSYVLRVRATPPATKASGWHEFKVTATANGKELGTIPFRVEMGDWALPQ